MGKEKKAYFLGPLIGGIISCLVVMGMVYFFLFRFSEEDEKEYNRLMLISQTPSLAAGASDPCTARQKRQGIQKDFIYRQSERSLNMRLLSEEAELIFDKREGSTQIIEAMQGVKAYMQEKLFYVTEDGNELLDSELPVSSDELQPLLPMQIIRVITAKEGSYYYKTDTCIAKNVVVERYLVPGHGFLQQMEKGKLIARGIAESIEFTLAKNDPSFIAKDLQGDLFLQGRS